MGRFINPFTDMGFKRIFGQEVNKNLLIDFLNDLLEGEKRIIDITFLDKEQLGTTADDRSCIYDIYCENENGERFIVEIQNRVKLAESTLSCAVAICVRLSTTVSGPQTASCRRRTRFLFRYHTVWLVAVMPHAGVYESRGALIVTNVSTPRLGLS